MNCMLRRRRRRSRSRRLELSPAEVDGPGGGRLQADDQPPERRLAAAGFTHQPQRGAAGDGQVDVRDRGEGAELAPEQTRGADREILDQVLDLDDGRPVVLVGIGGHPGALVGARGSVAGIGRRSAGCLFRRRPHRRDAQRRGAPVVRRPADGALSAALLDRIPAAGREAAAGWWPARSGGRPGMEYSRVRSATAFSGRASNRASRVLVLRAGEERLDPGGLHDPAGVHHRDLDPRCRR